MSTRRRSLIAPLIGVLCACALGPAAQAAAAPAPRSALLEAQRSLRALAGSSSLNKPAGEAISKLAGATSPSLWIDAREADAPSYGATVFTDSSAALSALQQLTGSHPTRASAAIGLVVGADRGLAAGAIAEARGGSSGLVAAARRALASGGRLAAAGQPVSAVGLFARAWNDAYTALARMVTAKITREPASEISAAAENALGSSKIALAGPMIERGHRPLRLGGKPEVFYAGSEACPFCGVQRWGMVVALSQFGTFSKLGLMQSSTTEQPEVRTFTFYGSSYRSPYIAFVPVEVISNVPKGFGFAHLQRLTPFERALLNNFDPVQQTPFVDVANRFIRIDSTVQPNLIAKLSWTQLAGTLAQPASTPAQAIAGEAEVLTAEICEATGGKPQSVCSAPVVGQYETALPLLDGRGGGCPTPQTASTAQTPQRRETPLARPARCGG